MSLLRFKMDYTLSNKATILDTLKKIDSLSSKVTRIAFVVDDHNRVLGSVSDGDCRRALIKGKKLDTNVTEIMNKNFTFLTKGKYDIQTIQDIRERSLKYIPEINEDGTLCAIRDYTDGKSYIPVDAVLMAGGKGERLRPLTLDTPKPLLKVADKPIIDYNIDNLLRYGIEHINVTINYLAEQIEKHFAVSVNEAAIKCIKEKNFLGTIGSLSIIDKWYNDTILLMNADLFTNIDIESFYIHFKKHNADMSVAAIPYNINIPYGIFDIENTREIKGITEKPNYYYYANAGIYLIKKDLLSYIPQNTFYNVTEFIDKLIKIGKKIIRFPIAGYWIDIGKPEDFKNVQEFARNLGKI